MSASGTDRKPRCKYLRANGDPCPNEATDPLEDIALCPKHLYRAHLVWLRHYKAALKRAS